MQDVKKKNVFNICTIMPNIKKSSNAFDDSEQVEYNLKIDLNFKAYKNQLFRLEQNIFPEFTKKINGVLLKKIQS